VPAIGEIAGEARQKGEAMTHTEPIGGVSCVFEASDEGGYTVTVPSMPGCISDGDTIYLARDNIRDAMLLYRCQKHIASGIDDDPLRETVAFLRQYEHAMGLQCQTEAQRRAQVAIICLSAALGDDAGVRALDMLVDACRREIDGKNN
jgi:hypothetical protein